MKYSLNLVVLVGVLSLIFLLPTFVIAATDTEQVTDVFQVNQVANYARPCTINGSYCSDNAVCNFTFQRPDNTFIVKNRTGDEDAGFHNVSVLFDEVGIHKVDIVCCDGIRCGTETLFANVTGSGFNDTLGFYILIIVLSIGVLLLGFWIQDGWIVILGTFGLYFLAVYILFNGIAGMKDLVTTWAIGITMLGVAMYISVKAGIEMMNY